ncbi:hypothetical protein TNCV_756531 [Trichonephila clavipes]|nr:hypothetical protein TNCV_756531 [Trichonephila clavipes]
MKADEPELTDLFARLNFYREQHHNAELCAIDQPQQCYSDTSGHSRRNRIQEQLSSCNHAFLPRFDLPIRALYQADPITSGHIYKLDMGWRKRFAFRFPETPQHPAS